MISGPSSSSSSSNEVIRLWPLPASTSDSFFQSGSARLSRTLELLERLAISGEEETFKMNKKLTGLNFYNPFLEKSSPIFSKSCQKCTHCSFSLKVKTFNIVPKIVKYFGLFCKRFCHQDLSQMAQSGRTGSKWLI